MFNKNYIIVGIVVVVIIIGAVFFLRGNTSTPNSAELDRGVKNLTQDTAAMMIKNFLQTNLPGVQKPIYDDKMGTYRAGFFSAVAPDNDGVAKLENDGFVKIISSDSYRNLGYVYDFTDNAKLYLIPREDKPNSVYLILAQIREVKVLGLTEPADTPNGKVVKADFSVDYELTPIGELIARRDIIDNYKGRMTFVKYQDGWRIDISQGY